MPITFSTKTRSKKRLPIKSSTDPLDQGCNVNCEEGATEAHTARCQKPKDQSEVTEVFERPLTRARKRYMARVCDMQPPVLKRRKNL